jgi:hypothetical protein
VLGASAICEYSIADQGILHAGVSEQTALGVKTSVGVGIMSGVSTIDGNFTATTAAMYISGSTNAELSFNNTQTSAAVEVKGLILNTETLDIDSAFTKTSNGIMIGSGVASKDLNMTQSSLGDLLFVEVNASVRKVIVDGQETEVPSKEDWLDVGTTANDESDNWTSVDTGLTDSWTEIQ